MIIEGATYKVSKIMTPFYQIKYYKYLNLAFLRMQEFFMFVNYRKFKEHYNLLQFFFKNFILYSFSELPSISSNQNFAKRTVPFLAVTLGTYLFQLLNGWVDKNILASAECPACLLACKGIAICLNSNNVYSQQHILYHCISNKIL